MSFLEAAKAAAQEVIEAGGQDVEITISFRRKSMAKGTVTVLARARNNDATRVYGQSAIDERGLDRATERLSRQLRDLRGAKPSDPPPPRISDGFIPQPTQKTVTVKGGTMNHHALRLLSCGAQRTAQDMEGTVPFQNAARNAWSARLGTLLRAGLVEVVTKRAVAGAPNVYGLTRLGVEVLDKVEAGEVWTGVQQ